MLEGNPCLRPQACVSAASSQAEQPLAPARAATAPSSSLSSSSPPPVTREGTAQSPSPWRMQPRAHHRAPRSRAPTQSAPSTLPDLHRAPALPHSPGPRTATGAQAAGRARRGARSPGKLPESRGQGSGGAAYRAWRPSGDSRGGQGAPLLSAVVTALGARCGANAHAWPWNRSRRPASLAARRPGSRRPRGCGKP